MKENRFDNLIDKLVIEEKNERIAPIFGNSIMEL